MSLIISDEILYSAQMSPAELRQEIAVFLFVRQRLSLPQAAQLADLPQWQFQALLASRQIPIHYDVAELEEDLRTLRELGRL